jgi:hypothetical protein
MTRAVIQIGLTAVLTAVAFGGTPVVDDGRGWYIPAVTDPQDFVTVLQFDLINAPSTDDLIYSKIHKVGKKKFLVSQPTRLGSTAPQSTGPLIWIRVAPPHGMEPTTFPRLFMNIVVADSDRWILSRRVTGKDGSILYLEPLP